MDHNAVMPVKLKPAAPWSQVKHSTTEPLRSSIPKDDSSQQKPNNVFTGTFLLSKQNLCFERKNLQ